MSVKDKRAYDVISAIWLTCLVLVSDSVQDRGSCSRVGQ